MPFPPFRGRMTRRLLLGGGAPTGGASAPTFVQFNRSGASMSEAGGTFSGFHHNEFDPTATIAVGDYIICLLTEENFAAGANRNLANASGTGGDPWETLANVFYDNGSGFPINAIFLGKVATASDVTAAFATWGNSPSVTYTATVGSDALYGSFYAVYVFRGVNTSSPHSQIQIQHNTGSADIVFPSMTSTFLNQLLFNVGIIKDTSGVTSVTMASGETTIHSPSTGGSSMESASGYQAFASPTAGINKTVSMAGTKPPHNAAFSILLRS